MKRNHIFILGIISLVSLLAILFISNTREKTSLGKCTEVEISEMLEQFTIGGKKLNEIEKFLNEQGCIMETTVSPVIIETLPQQSEIDIIYQNMQGEEVKATIDFWEVTGDLQATITSGKWTFRRIHA